MLFAVLKKKKMKSEKKMQMLIERDWKRLIYFDLWDEFELKNDNKTGKKGCNDDDDDDDEKEEAKKIIKNQLLLNNLVLA